MFRGGDSRQSKTRKHQILEKHVKLFITYLPYTIVLNPNFLVVPFLLASKFEVVGGSHFCFVVAHDDMCFALLFPSVYSPTRSVYSISDKDRAARILQLMLVEFELLLTSSNGICN